MKLIYTYYFNIDPPPQTQNVESTRNIKNGSTQHKTHSFIVGTLFTFPASSCVAADFCEMSDDAATNSVPDEALTTRRGGGQKDTSLPGLINENEWLLVRRRIKNNPEEVAGFIDASTGWTILHDLCSKPPTPEDIFRSVVELYPEAVMVQEKNYKATPLHVLCWSSQRSVRKVQILLEYLSPEDMMIRNRFGGTVLHSAAGSHAWLPVLKVLVEKHPPIVLERTHKYNHTALTALWHSHL
jgi:hypothetical protein